MFVSTVGKGDSTRVYVFESYRENGKVKKKIVKKLGYLSELTKNDPDALENLKKQLQINRDNIKEQRKAEEISDLKSILEAKNISNDKISPQVVYSNFIVRHLWNEYGLSKKIMSLQDYHNSTADFSYNDVIFTESFIKIIDPGSILNTYRYKSQLLGAPLSGVSLKQMYKSLDFVYNHKETIIKYINRNIDKKIKRNKNMIFYDVTNAYFEAQLSDQDKNIIRKNYYKDLKQILDTAVSQNLISKSDADSFLNGNFDFNILPESIRAEVRSILFLRVPGPSKECRFDLPIVSMALIVDDHAVPIDFELFSGSASEFKTMPKTIKKLQEKHNVKNTIVVADRGINSTENAKTLVDLGYGFIIAQKITNLKESERSTMLDSNGYTTKYILKDKDLPPNENNIFDIFKYKIIDYDKYDAKGNHVKCKLIFSHSKKREARDNKLIDKDENKAREAVKNNIDIPSSRKQWITFVNKEKGKNTKAKSVNEEAILKKREIAGYSGIIYHEIPGEKNNFSDEQILCSYHQLVQIEDCFRIMKTNLGLRPMYVRTEEHIQGHVMLCFLALVIIRLMQIKLRNYKNPMTIDEIIEALKQANLSVLCIDNDKEEKDKEDLYTNSTRYNIYRGRETLSDNEIKKELSKNKFVNNINIIMKCLGLTPLPIICNRMELLKCLCTTIPLNHPLIDPILHDYMLDKLEFEDDPACAGASA